MSGHTKGPWFIREVAHSNVPGQRAFAIDFNEDQEQVVDWVYEEADAYLIAAAPDLLEALEALFIDYKGLADSGDAGNWRLEDVTAGKMAMAAIAKARGEA